MKKILFILCFLIPFTTVNALDFYENNVINNKGVVLSKEEYNELSKTNSDIMIDLMDRKIINTILNYEPISESHYIVTTYEYDRYGNIISAFENETTKEIAKLVADNSNYYFNEEGILKYNNPLLQSAKSYSTDSKVINMNYYRDMNGDKTYTIHIWGEWYKLPLIRKFDVVAARWDVSNSNVSFYGVQSSDGNYTTYLEGTKNAKKASNGFGLSMNLHDNATNYLSYELYIYSDSSFGNKVYGTYQHAKHSNANTLAISQSYTFRSDGLGGVLYFSNPTYRSYYDGMKGLILG